MGSQDKVSSFSPSLSIPIADFSLVAYSASKGAIASLTLPMTRDLARYGIRVVTIAPSLFDSRMTATMSDKVRASLTRVMEFPCKTLAPLSIFLAESRLTRNSETGKAS